MSILPLSKKQLIPVFAGLLALSATAEAKPTGYNQISFSTEVKTKVDNDEVQATMSKKVQAKNAKSLAIELNSAMNNAMKIAKRYPTVTVTTGHNHTYPSYAKNGKINGWTGQASINIKSTDLAATSELIANLQENLVLGNLSFGVSEKRQDDIEKQMLVKASKAFQQQAQTLTSAWGANNYNVVSVQLNTGSNYNYPMQKGRMFAMEATADVPSQEFESGDSTITVTANGTIELVK